MTNQCAAEVADTLLAADALPERSLNVMLSVFAKQANNRTNGPAEREMFGAVARLLARVRDVRAERSKAFARADRQGRLLATGPDEALGEQFAQVVAGI